MILVLHGELLLGWHLRERMFPKSSINVRPNFAPYVWAHWTSIVPAFHIHGRALCILLCCFHQAFHLLRAQVFELVMDAQEKGVESVLFILLSISSQQIFLSALPAKSNVGFEDFRQQQEILQALGNEWRAVFHDSNLSFGWTAMKLATSATALQSSANACSIQWTKSVFRDTDLTDSSPPRVSQSS